ncbi:hypothetical protein LGK95_14300 [Clostridium algoriphilum]|uniref:hypothetical protein n=1 Tax=Clostridium algoriphilum TaxID=198347 RepID=UPI001CF5998D|nr:hypothetical protein [Clostridium algoriphilum]MCB2294671.1 hypothetical protein [Clostridium algoriphilum]
MSKEKTVEVGKELKQIYINKLKIEDVVCEVKNELFEVINKSSDVVIEKIKYYMQMSNLWWRYSRKC